MAYTLKTPNEPATKKQLWALFCATKEDYRNRGLTMQEACDILQSVNKKEKSVNKVPTIKTGPKGLDFAAILAEASAAADAAGDKFLADHPDYRDCCGFAYVNFADKRSAFYKYCKTIDRQPYFVPITYKHRYLQEMTIKEVCMTAAAKVLNSYGLNVYMSSRMD